MKKSHFLFAVFCTLVLGACNKQTIQPQPTDLGFDFQPLEKGHYVIYDVDSIIYDDFSKTIDTFRLEMKDEIGDMFIDNQGRESYRVIRSTRKKPTDAWQTNHVYFIMQDAFKLEWQENNLRFIKMVYPVKLNKKWSGNTLINAEGDLGWLNGWDYQYTDVLEPFNTGSRKYSNTHIIDQADIINGFPNNPDSYSAKTYSREVFAKDVGLIYREITNWVYQSDGSRFRKGFTAIMRAKNNN